GTVARRFVSRSKAQSHEPLKPAGRVFQQPAKGDTTEFQQQWPRKQGVRKRMYCLLRAFVSSWPINAADYPDAAESSLVAVLTQRLRWADTNRSDFGHRTDCQSSRHLASTSRAERTSTETPPAREGTNG